MTLTIELEREVDGRWIAQVMELRGCIVYGDTERDAVVRAQALAYRVIADQLEHGERDLLGGVMFETRAA